MNERNDKLANVTTPSTGRVHDHKGRSRIDPLIAESITDPLNLCLSLRGKKRRIIGRLNKPDFDFGLTLCLIAGKGVLRGPVGSDRFLDLLPLLRR